MIKYRNFLLNLTNAAKSEQPCCSTGSTLRKAQPKRLKPPRRKQPLLCKLLVPPLVTCIVAALCLPSMAETQQNAETRSFGKGRLNTIEGYRVKFEHAFLSGDTVKYGSNHRKEDETIPLEQIIRIEEIKGTHALEFALILGLSGLIGSVIGVQMGSENVGHVGGEVDEGVKTTIVLAMTGASTLIGALIGYSHKKHETTYTNPAYGINTSHFSPSMIYVGNGIYLGTGYRF